MMLKIIHCLPEIPVWLGVLYFIWQPYPKTKPQVHLKYLPGRSGGGERE